MPVNNTSADWPGPEWHERGYASREERILYLLATYSQYLAQGNVLDVGCWDGILRRFMPERYVGVDIGGTPDITIDLEQGRLPFDANQFETVVCLDVLEHLDNTHAVFAELLRVSSRYVIVTFPNAWSVFLRHILGGSIQPLKFYGLPTTPPVDRHRWFYSYTEAARFVRANAKRYGYRIIAMDPYYPRGRRLNRISRWLGEHSPLGQNMRFNAYFADVLWVVLDTQANG